MPVKVAAVRLAALADLDRVVAGAAQQGARLVAVALPWGADADALVAHAGRLARQHGVTLTMGPLLTRTADGQPCAAGVLVDSSGADLGAQVQTHLGRTERAAGYATGHELRLWDVLGFRVGLLPGADVQYPEVSRILCLRGANLLIHFAQYEAWTEAAFMARLWREVQSNQVFGIEACSGPRGRASVLAPVEMTVGFTGVLAQTGWTDASALAAADLDLDALAGVLRQYDVGAQRNGELYRCQLMAAYGAEPLPTGEQPSPFSEVGSMADIDGTPAPGSTRARVSLRDRITARGLAALLWWKSRSGLVGAALEQSSLRRGRPTIAPAAGGDTVRVGLAQTALRLVETAWDYAGHMGTLVQEAVAGGAQLVVFPEYITLPLLGFLPGVSRLARSGVSLQQGLGELSGGAEISVADVLRAIAPAAQRVYVATFSLLAARHRVHILAGSAILVDRSGRLHNVAHLFGPDGRLVGQQEKAHLVADETAWGFGRAGRLQVFATALGCLAAPVCMDHTYWETDRIVTRAGAQIVIDPSFDFDPAGYSKYKQARGIWGRVQESPAYGIHCFLVGDLLDYHARGYSIVCAPLAMTPRGNGIVAAARTNDQEEVILADLDLAALRSHVATHGPNFNVALYRRYLPAAYFDPRDHPDPASSGVGG